MPEIFYYFQLGEKNMELSPKYIFFENGKKKYLYINVIYNIKKILSGGSSNFQSTPYERRGEKDIKKQENTFLMYIECEKCSLIPRKTIKCVV